METGLVHSPSVAHTGGGYLARPQPSGLAEVINIILDKGIVIDAYVRVSLVGIELLTIDARIVIASVDTYLRFAEAVNRLELGSDQHKPGLPELVEGVAKVAHKRRLVQPAKRLTKPVKRLAKQLGSDARKALPAKKPAKRGLFGRARK